MNRYSMPMLRPKGDGLTVRWKCANSHPEMLASKAARTNAVTLTRKVSMPIASGIVEPPLTARKARPARERGNGGERQADPDRERWGDEVAEGQVGRGVRAHAHERGLSERGEAGDAGEQHEADHDQRVQADVVRLRDQELAARRRQHRHQRQGDDEDQQRDAAQIHCSSSSSWPCWNERQSRTGMISVKTMTSLNALA